MLSDEVSTSPASGKPGSSRCGLLLPFHLMFSSSRMLRDEGLHVTQPHEPIVSESLLWNGVALQQSVQLTGIDAKNLGGVIECDHVIGHSKTSLGSDQKYKKYFLS